MLSVNIKVRKARAAELEQFKKEAERFFMLRKCKHRKDSKTELHEYRVGKWQRLGSGFYSEAWAHDEYSDYVLKLGGSSSWGYDFLDTGSVGTADPWPVYAEYCTKVSGTHLPEVYHLDRPSETSAMFWAVMPKYEGHRELDDGYKLSELSVTRDSIFADMEKFPKWFATAYKYVDANSSTGINVDIHMGNIMYDDVNQRAVVTDPFSSTGF